MLNHIVLMGRLTASPELRITPSSVNVVTFTLAVDRNYKTRQGARETDFINCVAWRGTAEFIERNFSKGQLAVVSGRLQLRGYDKDGKRYTAAEVVVNDIYFAGPKPGQNEGQPQFQEDDDGELPC